MTNFQNRLLLTLISLPLVFIFLFWPQDTHIFIIIIVGIIIILGSYEINSLIYNKGIKVRKYFIPIVNITIYFSSYCYVNNFFNLQKIKIFWLLFILLFLICISFIYSRDIFKKDLTHSFEKMSYTLFGILYIGIPAFLIPLIFNIDFNAESVIPVFYYIGSKGTLTGSLLALFFIVLVWSNDIFAYVFGMAFGRNNVIGLTASPKKSWAGYIGGYFSTFFWVWLFYFIFNRFINLDWQIYLIFPIITGFLTPIGDLVESVFKRSANIKDSGNIIAGRGGILDSIDTVLFVFPIYFILLQIYFAIK